MRADQLREWLRRQPFLPFRIFVTGGQSYSVPSPEWMLVTANTTVIGVPGQSGDGEIVRMFDNSHISHVEPLSMADAPAQG